MSRSVVVVTRCVVDASHAGVDHVMAFSDLTRQAFVRRLGFAETLQLNTDRAGSRTRHQQDRASA